MTASVSLYVDRRCTAWAWNDLVDAIAHCDEHVLWPSDEPLPALCVDHWDIFAESGQPMPGPGEIPLILGGH